MNPLPRPSLGQMLRFVHDLGFTQRGIYETSIVCRHPGEDVVLLFLIAPEDEPIREVDFRFARKFLTERGFVSDEDFARFALEATRPQPAIDPTPAG